MADDESNEPSPPCVAMPPDWDPAFDLLPGNVVDDEAYCVRALLELVDEVVALEAPREELVVDPDGEDWWRDPEAVEAAGAVTMLVEDEVDAIEREEEEEEEATTTEMARDEDESSSAANAIASELVARVADAAAETAEEEEEEGDEEDGEVESAPRRSDPAHLEPLPEPDDDDDDAVRISPRSNDSDAGDDEELTGALDEMHRAMDAAGMNVDDVEGVDELTRTAMTTARDMMAQGGADGAEDAPDAYDDDDDARKRNEEEEEEEEEEPSFRDSLVGDDDDDAASLVESTGEVGGDDARDGGAAREAADDAEGSVAGSVSGGVGARGGDDVRRTDTGADVLTIHHPDPDDDEDDEDDEDDLGIYDDDDDDDENDSHDGLDGLDGGMDEEDFIAFGGARLAKAPAAAAGNVYRPSPVKPSRDDGHGRGHGHGHGHDDEPEPEPEPGAQESSPEPTADELYGEGEYVHARRPPPPPPPPPRPAAKRKSAAVRRLERLGLKPRSPDTELVERSSSSFPSFDDFRLASPSPGAGGAQGGYRPPSRGFGRRKGVDVSLLSDGEGDDGDAFGFGAGAGVARSRRDDHRDEREQELARERETALREREMLRLRDQEARWRRERREREERALRQERQRLEDLRRELQEIELRKRRQEAFDARGREEEMELRAIRLENKKMLRRVEQSRIAAARPPARRARTPLHVRMERDYVKNVELKNQMEYQRKLRERRKFTNAPEFAPHAMREYREVKPAPSPKDRGDPFGGGMDRGHVLGGIDLRRGRISNANANANSNHPGGRRGGGGPYKSKFQRAAERDDGAARERRRREEHAAWEKSERQRAYSEMVSRRHKPHVSERAKLELVARADLPRPGFEESLGSPAHVLRRVLSRAGPHTNSSAR